MRFWESVLTAALAMMALACVWSRWPLKLPTIKRPERPHVILENRVIARDGTMLGYAYNGNAMYGELQTWLIDPSGRERLLKEFPRTVPAICSDAGYLPAGYDVFAFSNDTGSIVIGTEHGTELLTYDLHSGELLYNLDFDIEIPGYRPYVTLKAIPGTSLLAMSCPIGRFKYSKHGTVTDMEVYVITQRGKILWRRLFPWGLVESYPHSYNLTVDKGWDRQFTVLLPSTQAKFVVGLDGSVTENYPSFMCAE